jgi:tetratricopeptide (TPR) repeat protein
VTPNDSPDGWTQVQDLFLQAADLPAADRGAFLAGACGGDARLRAEVESLLGADAADVAVIARAIEAEVGALLDDGPGLAGTRLGVYRLVEEIGRGGMGTVYLAERDDDQFRKSVAIKIVKRGMDSAEVVARFRTERQILAALEHPYIARLIDGGTTADGRPFFVMEHVEGQPIDAYCREHRLTLEARLRLFLRVCEAVSCAHRSLVVHRDLKPGNILITADGIPKLLDFGVAKLLDASSPSGLTIAAAGPLTPEYASPEQIRGLPITTAADVYALGAILFELLTGSRAQRMDTYSPLEIERIVCERDVPHPSAAAKAAGAPYRVPSDLDTIVLMAMRKEPERRYASVAQLADDVERYLGGRPVLARQNSIAYRARRFVGRNRVAVAAVFLVFFSLLAGIAIATVQARRAERRLAQLIELSNRSLFDVHAAIEGLPGATEARRQIVATTLRFLEDLAQDAGQDDRVRFMLSVSYRKVANVLGYPLQPNLGDSKGALANYEKSVALVQPLLAREPRRPEYVVQYVEARVGWATVLTDENRASAIAMLRETLPKAHDLQQLSPDDPHAAMLEGAVCSELVEALGTIDSAAAMQYSDEQLAAGERALAKFPGNTEVRLELATAYSQAGKMRNRRGELQQAVAGFRRAVELREDAIARDPSNVLTRRSLMITYGNLGGTLGNPLFPNLGDVDGAREYTGRALAIARDLAKADGSDQLAQYDLANALLFASSNSLPREEWPESLERLRESDAILQRLLAADPRSGSRLRTLALVQEYEGRRLDGLGRFDDALAEARRSLATTEQGLARNLADLTFTWQALASEEAIADILAHRGDRAGALGVARQSIARAERISASPSEQERARKGVASAYQHAAELEASFGDWAAARADNDRALAEWRGLASRGSASFDPARLAAAEALAARCSARLHL